MVEPGRRQLPLLDLGRPPVAKGFRPTEALGQPSSSNAAALKILPIASWQSLDK